MQCVHRSVCAFSRSASERITLLISTIRYRRYIKPQVNGDRLKGSTNKTGNNNQKYTYVLLILFFSGTSIHLCLAVLLRDFWAKISGSLHMCNIIRSFYFVIWSKAHGICVAVHIIKHKHSINEVNRWCYKPTFAATTFCCSGHQSIIIIIRRKYCGCFIRPPKKDNDEWVS